LDRRRFDALAGYIRSPYIALSARELAWFHDGSERLLGVVSLDTVDRDFVGTVPGRDALNRFRAVDLATCLPTERDTARWLESRLAELVQKPAEYFHQGDESGPPVDFFAPAVTVDRQSPVFRELTTRRGYTPALGLLRGMMHYFEDADGNFVEQFQTTGFDSRLWELYLYAAFTELGYGFEREHPAPDFHCVGLMGDFFIEATTVNPSEDSPTIDRSNEGDYFASYVPMKFGSALYSKLKRRYWEATHVSGHPLVVAIQDFHAPGSMTWSSAALVEQLYGIRQIEDPEGSGQIVSEPVKSYAWQGKEKPAGFFYQPDAEHISAVLANPGGTITKFNRIGFLAGFGDRDIKMFRTGLAYRDGGTEPDTFLAQVHVGGYEETWCEGLSVYHNPNARIPLPQSSIPMAAHHTVRDGHVLSSTPPFHPIGSSTLIMAEDATKESDLGSER
jgi:hypothetical protein